MMITVKFAYNFDCSNLKKQLEDYFKSTSFTFICYNEDHYKQKKHAYKLKASCGAKLTPFCAVYKDKELIKAFYTESKECNYQNIIKYNYKND